jgi:3-oxoadipate enol-lactonase
VHRRGPGDSDGRGEGRLDPRMERTFMPTWDATDLNHRLEGPEGAPVLVLSNSLGTALGMWDDQAPALRERFRILRYDTRGHGASPAPPGPYTMDDLGRDVLSLLDALGLECASFCGLSIGGMIGMWLASEAPERVDRLMLLCTSSLLGPRSLWDERIETAKTRGMRALVDGVLERWFTPGFRSRNPDAVEKVAAMLRATDPEGYAGCCAAIRDMDLRDRLPSVLAPTLVVSAADDPAAPPEHGRLIADAIPGARFGVVPYASHLANMERPEEITRLILEHLEPVAGVR